MMKSFVFVFMDNYYDRGRCDTMNNKGQALVEFVLILPIFIIILFTIY